MFCQILKLISLDKLLVLDWTLENMWEEHNKIGLILIDTKKFYISFYVIYAYETEHNLLHFFISLQASKRGFTNKLKRNGSQLLRKQWLYFQFLTKHDAKANFNSGLIYCHCCYKLQGFSTTPFETVKKGIL